MEATWKAGLEDVIATRSAITTIDGTEGRLYHRGYEIGELAGHVSFEGTTHLLWFGELPSAAERDAFAANLRAAHEMPPSVLALLRALPRDAHPLDALRTAVSLAATVDPDRRASDAGANLRKAFRLTALVPGVVAAWHELRMGREPVPATNEGAHAAHFLRLLHGRPPTPAVARVLDIILTLHADHELNASTFAVRVAVPRWRTSTRHSSPQSPLSRGHATAVRTRPCWQCCWRSETPTGRRRTSPLASMPTRGAPVSSGPTRGCASQASGTASTAWTTLGPACCATWRRRWRRRPDTRGCSRPPSVSMRR